MVEKLDRQSVDANLQSLHGWSLDHGKLRRDFQFPDFVEAFGFMTRAAIEAEKMDHHPEWCNVYGKVTVHLTTHEAGGITERDFALAKRLNELATNG